jgi:hypothetical protein
MLLHARFRVRSLLPLAVIVGALIPLLAPAAASATPVTLSLLNARSYCLNRQGGGNSAGTTVFLYACSGGNNGWTEINNPLDAQDPRCGLSVCMEFQDPNTGAECFGMNTSGSGGVLQSCYVATAIWTYSNAQIRPIFWAGGGWLHTPK